MIVDTNGNGVWDPGNYLLMEQPERVLHFPTEVNIRSNWSVEFEWIFKLEE